MTWRKSTQIKVRRSYACLLKWLDTTGQLRQDETPAERLNPARLDAFCSYLKADRLAPTTIGLRLTALLEAFLVMAPDHDPGYLRKLIKAYPKKGDPLKKRQRLQEAEALLQFGHDLMRETDQRFMKKLRGRVDETATPSRWDAIVYRDGLMIALLASRAMRLRNLTSIETGIHLDKFQWTLTFPASETKNHRPWVNIWPEAIRAHLLRYLEAYRPVLLGGQAENNHLWLSQRPGPLTENGIYYAITTRTKAAFGVSLNPHLFRDAIATSIAAHAPESVFTTRHILGHASHQTGQAYYNQARSTEASESLNAALKHRRARSKRRRRTA